MKITDKLIQNVKQKFEERSQVGIKKYGRTLEYSEEDMLAFVNHAQEEAMDYIAYLEKLKHMHKGELDRKMTQMFYAILGMVDKTNDGKLYQCDLEELYNAYGYTIDKLPF